MILDDWQSVCRGQSLNFCLGLCRILPYKTAANPSEVPKPRHTQSCNVRERLSREATTGQKKGEDRDQRSRLQPRKSLTKEPDDVSGKRLTKTKVLVVHR